MGKRLRGEAVSAIGLAVMLGALIVGTATAAQESRESYTLSTSGSFQCTDGTWVDWTTRASGTLSIRAGTGKLAGVFFTHDRLVWSATDTRRSDGAALHWSGRNNFRETRARHVEGTIFKVTSVGSGLFTVTDDAGNVIIRDRGSIRETILFDTLGDDSPDGETIESISIRASGQHPGAEFESCSILGG
jgi:hypothetical protein